MDDKAETEQKNAVEKYHLMSRHLTKKIKTTRLLKISCNKNKNKYMFLHFFRYLYPI